MTDELNALFLKITGELAAARSDIQTLLQLQKEGVESRGKQGDEIHRIDKRLTLMERDVEDIRKMVQRLDAARQAQAIGSARLAAYLTLAGMVVAAIATVITALIPPAIIEWWTDP
jgi:hypothetical protein